VPTFPEECNLPNYASPNNRRGGGQRDQPAWRDRIQRRPAALERTVERTGRGANNVFGRVGPTMYSQPSANVSYYGGFDIGRFLYMKYTQRF
jgi:iron complex outermembrane receptor protein